MTDHMKAPLLFPCASGVKMPQVGSDETSFKPQPYVAPPRPPVSKPPNRAVSKSYIKKISTGLSFAEDVVKDRCIHTLPYSDKYFFDALDVSDIIPQQTKTKQLVGRHDARGSDKRHMPCHIQNRTAHKLKPMKRKILKRAQEMLMASQTQEEMGRSPRSPPQTGNEETFFLTEAVPPLSPQPPPDGSTSNREWDEYLMSILSQNTAEWIVKQRLSPGPHREKLEHFVEACHGPIQEEEPELVKDNISEIDFDTKDDGAKRKWKKGNETILDRVREVAQSKGLPTDPYADDNMAAFYRLPAGVRRAKKHQDKEEAGAINTTAYEIEVVPYTAPPLPTLRDHMNPAVGSKIYETSNRYEQEWLTGSRQIHQKAENQGRIVMDSDNKYRKLYVAECPRDPDTWCPQVGSTSNNTTKRQERGLRRWRALPEPVDDTAEKLHLQPPGGTTVIEKTANGNGKKITRSNQLLIRMVDDWRQKWNLDMRYSDASPEDLIRDMADIHPHIRLKAILTCARAAEYRPPPELGIQLDSEVDKLDHVKLLPESLFTAVELCLEDESLRVRRAAAIALYTLERPTDKAESILRDALQDQNAVDRWTASQCLAYYGECDSDVVAELISQLLNTEDPVKHEQAGALLSRLSENSTLVHSMIGEQLNSSSWRHRTMACRVLPKLNGHINKDLVNKLIHLMWTDWHGEVRKIAAQTLGKTGHGKQVHDELKDKIVNGKERARVEAVSKVGQLGIMTAKLLPVFLQCFQDNYVSIRMEVCVACANLGIRDDQVLDRLVHVVTYDPIWKVKALALQALGKIGVVSKPVRDCVLWAFRYEDKPGVRVQACHTIILLQLREAEVAQILQDRYLVETSDMVKKEIISALELFDISPSQDMDMVTQIKTEVRKLCTRNNICAQITLNEEEDEKEANLQRMIYQPPGIATKEHETPRYRPISRKVTRVTSPGSDPRGTENSRPPSRPFSQETNTADREIMAIFDRYDDDGTSQYTDHELGAFSRQDTTYSQKTQRAHEDQGDNTSLPKSRVTFASPEADYRDITADDGLTDLEEQTEDSVQREELPRAVNLGEAQTYVEVSGASGLPDESSEDVVLLQHHSPDSQQSAGSAEPPEPTVTGNDTEGEPIALETPKQMSKTTWELEVVAGSADQAEPQDLSAPEDPEQLSGSQYENPTPEGKEENPDQEDHMDQNTSTADDLVEVQVASEHLEQSSSTAGNPDRAADQDQVSKAVKYPEETSGTPKEPGEAFDHTDDLDKAVNRVADPEQISVESSQ